MTDIEAHYRPEWLLVGATTDDGQAWLDDNLDGEQTWDGDYVLVEHSFGPDLLLAAHMDGLTVSLDGLVVDRVRQ